MIALATLTVAGPAQGAPTLEYSLEGLSQSTRDNVQAYLGKAPETIAARGNFLASAERQVRLSLEALGYYEPTIELHLQRSEPTWQLQIDVDRGPRVRLGEVAIELSGAAADDPAFDELVADTVLQSGAALHHGHYEDFKQSLLSLGQARGYFDGKLVAHSISVNATEGRADIHLGYDSGQRYRFGPIHLSHSLLDEKRLQQLQTFEEGEPFELEKLQRFQGDLQRTGFFDSALVRPLLAERSDGAVPIRLELQAAAAQRYGLGLGYSSDTRERVSLTWRTPLLNHYGHRQETRLEYSPVRPNGSFTYTMGLTHPLDDILQLRARVEDNEYGDLESHQQEAGMRRERRTGPAVWRTSLRFLREDWDLVGSSKRNSYLLPGLSWAHTLRIDGDRVLDPAHGFSQYYEAEFGSDRAGSDLNLVRLYGNWRGVYSLSDRHRLVGRLELGAVFFDTEERPDLAPSLSFFAGGSYSLRGYAFQSLGPSVTVEEPDGEPRELVIGGDRLAIGSAEYQYYVNDTWRAAVFVDSGNAFNGSHFNAVTGAGFGVHYLSPVGAIRLDVANSVSEDDPSWRVHLTIGAEF